MNISKHFQTTPEDVKELVRLLAKYLGSISETYGIFDKYTCEEMQQKVRDYEDQFLVYPKTNNYNYENVIIAGFAFAEYVNHTEYIEINLPDIDLSKYL